MKLDRVMFTSVVLCFVFIVLWWGFHQAATTVTTASSALPPSPPSLGEAALVGKAILTTEVLRGEFAEPYDQLGLYVADGAFHDPPSYFFTTEMVHAPPTPQSITVHSSVHAPAGGLIHKQGYYYTKGGRWVSFEYQPDVRDGLDIKGESVQDSDGVTNWIRNRAAVELPVDSSTVFDTFQQGENYIVAYVCLRPEGEESWKCGCKARGEGEEGRSDDCGYWMLQSFSICPTGKVFDQYGGCDDPEPVASCTANADGTLTVVANDGTTQTLQQHDCAGNNQIIRSCDGATLVETAQTCTPDWWVCQAGACVEPAPTLSCTPQNGDAAIGIGSVCVDVVELGDGTRTETLYQGGCVDRTHLETFECQDNACSISATTIDCTASGGNNYCYTPSNDISSHCKTPDCGDGIQDPGEGCDDGNTNNADGCSNTCISGPICGDGTVNQAWEQCDDGNTNEEDGCTSSCTTFPFCGNAIVEIDGADHISGTPDDEDCDGVGSIPDWETCQLLLDPSGGSRFVGQLGCTANCKFDTSACSICGNGVREGSEECDDGNAQDGDGCSYLCQIEICGNGVVDSGETCDDGNLVAGDGCSPTCRVERCGNGILDSGEECDNNYLFPAGVTCASELGNQAATGSLTCTVGSCTISTDSCSVPGCGNGIPDAGEQCDDGNTNNNDGCFNTCIMAQCGDGVVRTDTFPVGESTQRFEDCDDGNAQDGDGCSASCSVELGSTCTGEPSVCTGTGVCGDGVVALGEACDIGGVCDDGTVCRIGTGCSSGACLLASGHGCDTRCQVESGWACVPYYPNVPSSISICYNDQQYHGQSPLSIDQATGLQLYLLDNRLFTPSQQCQYYNPLLESSVFIVSDRCLGEGDVREVAFAVGDPADPINRCTPYTISCPSAECRAGACKLGEGDSCTSNDECASALYCDVADQNSDGQTNVCTRAVCGNAISEVGRDPAFPFEECDDGNVVSEDGCSDICSLEMCGDKVVQAGLGEECDDGADTDNNDECTEACKFPACGDGFAQSGETCDDGNIVAGDGCSELCVREFCGDGVPNNGNEECDDGNYNPFDACHLCRNNICGDGVRWHPINGGTEQCDDNNNYNGDGCSAMCALEFCGDRIVNNVSEDCDDGNTQEGDGCSAICLREYCGDGIPQSGIGEQCDDRNLIDGDGCSSWCQTEFCGDGKTQIEIGEACDNFGTVSGDGCTGDCSAIEPGWSCTVSSTDASDCYEICGDRLVVGSEACDDGNLAPGDGCSTVCQRENGWNCPVVGGAGGDCTEVCGDSFIVGREECDDGKTNSGDGCDGSCKLETCYYQELGMIFEYPYGLPDYPLGSGSSSCFDPANSGVFCNGAGVCIECGNSIVEAGEACDDGNIAAGDGCAADCSKIEACSITSTVGWVCPSSGGVCTPICGDGCAFGAESCDDGNLAAGDGCTATCTSEVCGDGILQSSIGEQCDDGNNGNQFDACLDGCISARCGDSYLRTDLAPRAAPYNLPYEYCDDGNVRSELTDGSCSPGCWIKACGNSILDYGEQCEDGNTISGDGCGPTCQYEACGNGVVDPSEQCDDGNLINDDGCTIRCAPPRCGDGLRQMSLDEQCDDGDTVNNDECTNACATPRCGDSIIQPSLNEQCDDGNTMNSDGCSSICLDEFCGDGRLQTGEQCDDGNMINGDRCDASCTPEICGNGILQNWVYLPDANGALGPEQCDDGNLLYGDGCSNWCQSEYCGDSFYDANGVDGVLGNADDEQCDHGNTISGDGCSADCLREYCGDGIPQSGLGEECDDGKRCRLDGRQCLVDADCPILGFIRDVCVQRTTDACTNSCKTNICGDGTIFSGIEECDDGNSVNNDRCSNACYRPRCGDSILQEIVGEQCDDGNLINADGCTDKCELDSDLDGVANDYDVCPLISNPVQIDIDSDGRGNDCDNCPRTYNPDQTNTCYDPRHRTSCGVGLRPPAGDECDADYDNWPEWVDLEGHRDNCPLLYNPSQSDEDGDGVGDACDLCGRGTTDADGDGDQDGCDNCPTTSNSDQADRDSDSVGDACDNCPEISNPSQRNSGDSDNIGNVCDPDYCGNGICAEGETCSQDDSACSPLPISTCYENNVCRDGCLPGTPAPIGSETRSCNLPAACNGNGVCVDSSLKVQIIVVRDDGYYAYPSTMRVYITDTTTSGGTGSQDKVADDPPSPEQPYPTYSATFTVYPERYYEVIVDDPEEDYGFVYNEMIYINVGDKIVLTITGYEI